MDRTKLVAAIIVFGLLLGGTLLIIEEPEQIYYEQHNQILIGDPPDYAYEPLSRNQTAVGRSGFIRTADSIRVTVAHGGGCPEREPDLDIYWDGTAETTQTTATIDLTMVHTNYDRCEAIVTSRHTIPLSPFRKALDKPENTTLRIGSVQISRQDGTGPF